MVKMKQKTKNKIIVAFCILVFIALQVATNLLARKGITSFNGVFMAFQYATCLVLMRFSSKRGAKISLALMSISIAMLVPVLVIQKDLSPLPGFVNAVFYLITMLVLNKHARTRERESITDMLTGLLNRRGLYKQLQRTIENEKKFSVIYVDLGNFKFINDNYGHAYGDDLLKKISRRINNEVGDHGTISRLSGDEFVVVLKGDVDAKERANMILDSIRRKAIIEVDGAKVDCYLTCYAGVSYYPEHTENYENLIKYADIAMYHATKANSSEACVFDLDMAQKMAREVELEKLIKEGLEKDYFYLVYQPQYLLQGKMLRGFESLLRMETPDGTFISPGEFIPVAEKGDLILRIDDYVLDRAMREFKPLVDHVSGLTVSINVSAKNIASLDFPEKIKNLLEMHEFPASNLEIEITEYCLVDSVDITINNIKKLRALGVQIALDDFGTGYTSLNYLAKMPINLLKVDKSLIDDIENSSKSRDFVRAVISMGHLMGCEVISEGVEDDKQLELLGEMECDYIQGYVWGKPLPYSEAKSLSLN